MVSKNFAQSFNTRWRMTEVCISCPSPRSEKLISSKRGEAIPSFSSENERCYFPFLNNYAFSVRNNLFASHHYSDSVHSRGQQLNVILDFDLFIRTKVFSLTVNNIFCKTTFYNVSN